MKLTHEFIFNSTGAKCLSHAEYEFKTIGSDTRKDLSALLFIALKGEQFDAHQFLQKAVDAGAKGVMVHDESVVTSEMLETVAVYVVPDTLRALQKMATAYRKKMKAKIIGITGSNGKTTAKEFTSQILSTKFKTHYSAGSFNNHWGVPFSLFEMNETHEIAVIEMGMNHSGEIAELVRIALPDIVTCTMVGRAHIENFGRIEGIAAAKEEIYLTAKDNAIRLFSLDQTYTREMLARSEQLFPRSKKYTFSAHEPTADLFLKVIDILPSGLMIRGHIEQEEVEFLAPIFGPHNIINILAAASIARAVGMSVEEIKDGIHQLKSSWGRNQFLRLKSGAQAIFDGYNANPDSMQALIQNSKLVSVQGQRIAVLGQMRELGDLSMRYHEELGELVGKAQFDAVFFIGADGEAFQKGLSKSHFKNPAIIDTDYSEALGQQLSSMLHSGDVVFLKASRGTRIERFLEPLEPYDFKFKTN